MKNKVFLLLLLIGMVLVTKAQTTYYYKGSGSISSTARWGTNTDGSGTAPSNFTSNNQVFQIRNTTSVSISSSWTVSGTNSKVVIGNSSVAAITVTHSGGTFSGTVDIATASSGSNTLILQQTDANSPVLGTLSSGSTVTYDKNSAQTVQAKTYHHLSIINSGTRTAGGAISAGGTLTINSVSTLDMATYQLSGAFTTSGTGYLLTQNTSSTPVTSGKTWSYIVSFNGTSQTIPAGTFTTYLNIAGSGTKTAAANLTVNGTLNLTSGLTLDMSTYQLLGSLGSVTGTGTLNTQNTSSTPLPAFKSWLGDVVYNSSSAQTIASASYVNLTASGGDRTLASTITISGVFTTGAGTYTTTSSTVNFNGTGAQTVPALNYENLTVSGARTTNSVTFTASATTGVSGTFTASATFTSGNYITTNSTLDFNGGVQTIPAFTYNSLTISGTGDKTAAGNITVNRALTINSGRILSMSTYTLSGITTTSGTGTLRTQNTSSTPIPSGDTWTFTVEYNSSSAQTIVSGNYTNLNGTGANRTLSNSGTIGISGTFTKGAGSYTTTSSTVDFNGTSQTIPAFNFNHLTASGSGTKTLSGAISVAGTLTVSSSITLNLVTYALTGAFTTSGTGLLTTQVTGVTPVPSGKTWAFDVEYNGTGAQTIVAGTYSNLTISGSRTTNSVTLISGSTISISGTFTPSATFSSGNYITTNNTVAFNGSSSQTIPAFTYNNLTSSSSGARTLSSSGTIAINGTFTTGTNVYTIGTSTVQFNTASANIPVTSVSSGANYYNMIVAGGTRTFVGNITIGNNLIVTGGTLQVNNATANTITVNGNYSQSAGTLDMNAGTSGASTLSIKGNFSMTGTALATTVGAGAPNGVISFSGAGTIGSPQTISFTTPANNVFVDYSVENGTVAQLNSDIALSLYTSITFMSKFTVKSGGTLNMQGYAILDENSYGSGGSNILYVNSGATLITAHASGMSGSTASANTKDSIHNGANFEFKGAITGTFPTYPLTTTINNLTTNRASGVTMSQHITVGGTLALTSGNIVVNGNTLTLNGSISGTGSITGSATSNLAIRGSGSLGGNLSADQTTVGTTNLFNNITVNRSGETITLGNNLVVSGTFLDSAGTVAFGNTTLSGTGAFTLISGAGISIGNVNGITSSGATGNVQVSGTRTFSTSGNYTYSGSATQVFGNGLPATVNNLTINNGHTGMNLNGSQTINGTLTLSSGKLSVGANTLTLNGGFSGSGSNSLKANGASSSLTIGGSGSFGTLYVDQTTSGTTNRFQNLTFNRNGQTITLGNSLEIISTVTPTDGTLASAGNLVLVSDSVRTARVAVFGASADITGNINVQRYVPAVARRYRMLSPGVSGFTFNDLKDDMFVTGPGGISNGFDETPQNNTTIFTYQESTTGGRGWKAISGTSQGLSAGQGAFVFVRGDRTLSSPQWYTAPFVAQNTVTLDFTGPINKGNFSPSLTYTNTGSPTSDGWNLIGNPYPSPIDWTLVTKSNIATFTYAYDPSTNSYIANDGSQIIASGQGFFVQANGASPSVTFTESCKSSGTPLGLFKAGATNRLTIRMILDSLNSDVAWLRLNNSASMNYLATEDAIKFTNSGINMGFRVPSGPTNVQLNTVPPLTNVSDTFVLFANAAANTYRIEFSQLQNIPATKAILLRDLFTNTITDIRSTQVYNFTISNAASQGDRFQLIIIDQSALPVDFISINATLKNTTDAEITWSTATETNNDRFVVEKSTDNMLFEETGTIKGAGNSQVTMNYTYTDKGAIKSGVDKLYYRIRQIDLNGSEHLSQVVSLSVAKMNTSSSTMLVYPNPANTEVSISSAQSGVALGVIKIADITGKIIREIHSAQDKISFDISSLQNGIYFIHAEGMTTQKLMIKH